MGRKKRKRAVPKQSRRVWWQVMIIGSVFVLGGLGLLFSSVAYKWRLSEKADRLRLDGVPVAAAASGSYGGSGRFSRPDALTVTYTYGGSVYQKRIPCGDTGCDAAPGSQITVWVDQGKPTEFVAANGHTDGSFSLLNSWRSIVAGSLFAAIGGTGMFAVLYGDRLIALWEARRTRRGRRAA